MSQVIKPSSFLDKFESGEVQVVINFVLLKTRLHPNSMVHLSTPFAHSFELHWYHYPMILTPDDILNNQLRPLFQLVLKHCEKSRWEEISDSRIISLFCSHDVDVFFDRSWCPLRFCSQSLCKPTSREQPLQYKGWPLGLLSATQGVFPYRVWYTNQW